jgi:putative tryptophan/tyrosine transport system substrate-binding protein
MRRREVIALMGGTAAWPLGVCAQQSDNPVIGVLGSASAQPWTARLRAFREGLAATGFAEGRNVVIEYRWAEGHNDRLPALAAQLVDKKVRVIVVLGNTASAIAAKAATDAIPIVFRVAGDPVELGLVEHMNRPGRNVTGLTTLGVEVGPKELELLRELVPSASVVAALVNPSNPLTQILSRTLLAAARKLDLELHMLFASADPDFESIFAELKELRADALVIGVDAFFNSRNERIAALALRNAVPAISPYREFAEAGGLMSYGGSIVEASRQAGVYTGRIMNNERPGDLPVLQSAKFELVLNLNTAKALRLTIPPTLLARADEVIE